MNYDYFFNEQWYFDLITTTLSESPALYLTHSNTFGVKLLDDELDESYQLFQQTLNDSNNTLFNIYIQQVNESRERLRRAHQSLLPHETLATLEQLLEQQPGQQSRFDQLRDLFHNPIKANSPHDKLCEQLKSLLKHRPQQPHVLSDLIHNLSTLSQNLPDKSELKKLAQQCLYEWGNAPFSSSNPKQTQPERRYVIVNVKQALKHYVSSRHTYFFQRDMQRLCHRDDFYTFLTDKQLVSPSYHSLDNIMNADITTMDSLIHYCEQLLTQTNQTQQSSVDLNDRHEQQRLRANIPNQILFQNDEQNTHQDYQSPQSLVQHPRRQVALAQTRRWKQSQIPISLNHLDSTTLWQLWQQSLHIQQTIVQFWQYFSSEYCPTKPWHRLAYYCWRVLPHHWQTLRQAHHQDNHYQMPPALIEQVRKDVRTKQAILFQQQIRLLETMATRIEAASILQSLQVDDVVYAFHHTLAQSKLGLFQNLREEALQPRQGFSSSLIMNFQQAIAQFSRQNTNDQGLIELNTRVTKTIFFRKPSTWGNVRRLSKSLNQLAHQPEIWLAINSCQSYLTSPTHIRQQQFEKAYEWNNIAHRCLSDLGKKVSSWSMLHPQTQRLFQATQQTLTQQKQQLEKLILTHFTLALRDNVEQVAGEIIQAAKDHRFALLNQLIDQPLATTPQMPLIKEKTALFISAKLDLTQALVKRFKQLIHNIITEVDRPDQLSRLEQLNNQVINHHFTDAPLMNKYCAQAINQIHTQLTILKYLTPYSSHTLTAHALRERIEQAFRKLSKRPVNAFTAQVHQSIRVLQYHLKNEPNLNNQKYLIVTLKCCQKYLLERPEPSLTLRQNCLIWPTYQAQNRFFLAIKHAEHALLAILQTYIPNTQHRALFCLLEKCQQLSIGSVQKFWTLYGKHKIVLSPAQQYLIGRSSTTSPHAPVASQEIQQLILFCGCVFSINQAVYGKLCNVPLWVKPLRKYRSKYVDKLKQIIKSELNENLLSHQKILTLLADPIKQWEKQLVVATAHEESGMPEKRYPSVSIGLE